MNDLFIRPATASDAEAICALAREVVADGTTYVFSPAITDEELRAYWLAPYGHTFVACIDDEIAGFYIIKPNHPGRGSHVANGSYVVSPRFSGRGIGYTLGEHSIAAAQQLGFKAMQYNIVVATNTNAVRLWKKLGFEIVGTLPQVFDHPHLGLVDAYVMHRFI